MTDCASVIPMQGSKDYVRLAKDMGIDLTVAGPETVLVDGLAERFKEAGLAFFGPVSYTHLDVYKRQPNCRAGSIFSIWGKQP